MSPHNYWRVATKKARMALIERHRKVAARPQEQIFTLSRSSIDKQNFVQIRDVDIHPTSRVEQLKRLGMSVLYSRGRRWLVFASTMPIAAGFPSPNPT